MFFPRPLQARFSINLDHSPAYHVLRWTTWPNSYKPRCSHDNRWSCGREILWMWNSIFRAIKDRSIGSVSVRWAPPSCPHQAGFEITNSQVFLWFAAITRYDMLVALCYYVAHRVRMLLKKLGQNLPGDATARLWEISSGQELLCLRGHRRDSWIYPGRSLSHPQAINTIKHSCLNNVAVLLVYMNVFYIQIDFRLYNMWFRYSIDYRCSSILSWIYRSSACVMRKI